MVQMIFARRGEAEAPVAAGDGMGVNFSPGSNRNVGRVQHLGYILGRLAASGAKTPFYLAC